MDTPIPSRLRLLKPHSHMKLSNGDDTPVAGPSRISPPFQLHDLHDEDDDSQSTPRMTANIYLASEKNTPFPYTPSAPPVDHHARLRDALARMNSLESPPAPAPPSDSDRDSDFESVDHVSEAPSMHRQSLRQLFSHALREPGDTPRRPKQRRNSINASSTEESPRKERVERERADNKGKRKSVSDEEAERLSKSSSMNSDTSSRPSVSSAAATFEALRQRLGPLPKTTIPPIPRAMSDVSDVVPDQTGNSVNISEPKHFNSSTATGPMATSTPMRSAQMPSEMQLQSNLLDQDSEMQRVMNGTNSYEGDTVQAVKKMPFLPARPSNGRGSTPARPLSWTSPSKSRSTHTPPQARRSSDDFSSSSSRPSSALSYVDDPEYRHGPEKGKLLERERGWNHPHLKSPARPTTPDHSHHHHSHSSPSHSTIIAGGRASPRPQLSRKSSAASLRSDDGSSSRASSVSSRSEYRERLKEADEDQNKERERLWNRPHSRLRSLSNVSMNSPPDRSRTQSHPTRPETAQGFLSPDRNKRSSLVSMSSSSRSNSPSSSTSGRDPGEERGQEVVQEVVHVRERNWNSPHPNWKMNQRRSVSPLPGSPNISPSQKDIRKTNGSSAHTTHHHTHSHSRGSADETSPMKSPPPRDKPKAKAGTPKEKSVDKSTSLKDRSLGVTSLTPSTSKSPSLTPSPRGKLPRPTSPHSQPSAAAEKAEFSKIPSFATRAGWQFPRSRVPLPPLDLDDDLPRSPSPPRPASRTSTLRSQIPVRSPKTVENGISRRPSSPPEDSINKKKGHRRSLTELSQSAGAIPSNTPLDEEDEEIPELPEIVLIGDTSEDVMHESDQDSPGAASTPLARSTELPPIDPPQFSPPRPSLPDVGTSLDDAMTRPDSPPPTPPSELSQPTFSLSLQTPPRRPSLQTSRLEFQTPSPPKNLPDLPGPPSSEDEAEHGIDDDRTPIMRSLDSNLLGNLTAMKTPKPPGAWADTPPPFARVPPPRPSSTPPERTPPASDLMFATPSATNLTRANTLPLQTPAPPGAWAPTPGGSLRRKSILKVRFDIEPGDLSSDSMASVPIVGPSDLKPLSGFNFKPISSSRPSNKGTTETLPNGTTTLSTPVNGIVESPEEITPIERSSTPPPLPPVTRPVRSPKAPSVRVVDAFGRETNPDEPPPDQAIQKVKGNGAPVTWAPPVHREPDFQDVLETPKASGSGRAAKGKAPEIARSRPSVRIVDALGREIIEGQNVTPTKKEKRKSSSSSKRKRDPAPVEELSDDFVMPTSHNEALARVRETIAHLVDDLDLVDRSCGDLALDENRLDALEGASNAARKARQRITESLRIVKSAEDELRNKFGSVGGSNLSPSNIIKQVSPGNFFNMRTIILFLVLQVFIFLAMYRGSVIYARRLFFSHYFDPFSPDIHTHLANPYTFRSLIPSATPSFSWSISSVPDTVYREGWITVFSQVFGNFTCFVSDSTQYAWDSWVVPQFAIPRDKWPPT